MVYYTSDTHFGHANIITYCSRPFNDVHHMNVEMTNRWNARVTEKDTVYHLGDFAMGNKSEIPRYLERLNGNIIFVVGNHDRRKIFAELGYETHESLKQSIGIDSFLYLHHEPYYLNPPDPKMLFFLCGHVHTQWKRKNYHNGQITINVGVDQWDFTPRTLYELLA